MKMRVLFVDDESLVLQGLERLLRPMRSEWEMRFVTSGAVALESLRDGPYDVIVSDMMMPGMNGVQLLEQVRTQSPNSIRIVLSGHTEKQLALKAVGVAHQFLSKPCDAAVMRSTISRVTQLGFVNRSTKLIELVGQLERLPSLPSIYLQLEAMLENPCSTTRELGLLISRDMALTAQLLKVVNSAFFGLAQHVSEPTEAVAYLGFDTLKAVVLAASLYDQCHVEPGCGFCIESAAEHGQIVGAVARAIAESEKVSRTLVEECFTAGMLHDVGRLVLASNLPAQYRLLESTVQKSYLANEIEIFGTTHPEVGGYLLGLWGLPSGVVETTRSHHSPAESAHNKFGSLVAVHVADYLVHAASGTGGSAPLDESWLANIGLVHRLPAWRAAAANILAAKS